MEPYIFVLVAALVIATIFQRPKTDLIRACTAEMVDKCADAICEGSLEPEDLIRRAARSIDYCLENPSSVPEEYFETEYQRTLLDGDAE